MPRPKLSDAPKAGALAERTHPDGRRKIKLRNKERRDLVRQRRSEQAVSLFLDLDNAYSWNDIAEIMEISPSSLKDLTKSMEFVDAYNAMFAELGHDPRYQAAISALSDLLPVAVRELKNLLIGNSPATVKLRAALKIIELNGISPSDQTVSDRAELAAYLKDNKITNINFILPDDFDKAYQNLGVVEGEFDEVDEEQDPVSLPPGRDTDNYSEE